MIKNKTLYIKVSFKTYLKILKIFQVPKQTLFYKRLRTVIKNYFSKLYLKTVTEQEP